MKQAARARCGRTSAVSELAAQQHAFAAALASVDEARRHASAFRGTSDLVLARLAVYRGNAVAASAKALAGAYPIVAKIVGEEFFEALAREYSRRHPSLSGDLNEFGDSLAEFLEEFPHTRDLPYLPDVARMEWLVHRAHYAADAAPLDPAGLAATGEENWERLRFVLAPACSVMASRWPLGRIWEVHQDDYEGEVRVDLDAGPGRILVYRPRYRVLVGSLSGGSFRFLASAANGASLAAALDSALGEESTFDLGAALAAWIEAGVLVDALIPSAG